MIGNYIGKHILHWGLRALENRSHNLSNPKLPMIEKYKSTEKQRNTEPCVQQYKEPRANFCSNGIAFTPTSREQKGQHFSRKLILMISTVFDDTGNI